MTRTFKLHLYNENGLQMALIKLTNEQKEDWPLIKSVLEKMYDQIAYVRFFNEDYFFIGHNHRADIIAFQKYINPELEFDDIEY
jgi:hypothetical protein